MWGTRRTWKLATSICRTQQKTALWAQTQQSQQSVVKEAKRNVSVIFHKFNKKSFKVWEHLQPVVLQHFNQRKLFSSSHEEIIKQIWPVAHLRSLIIVAGNDGAAPHSGARGKKHHEDKTDEHSGSCSLIIKPIHHTDQTCVSERSKVTETTDIWCKYECLCLFEFFSLVEELLRHCAGLYEDRCSRKHNLYLLHRNQIWKQVRKIKQIFLDAVFLPII